MTLLTAAVAGVLGLCVGSFLNVVAWRVPRGQSLNHPRSSCPSCQQPIAARDNIPVLSWLLLRGRCRRCGTTISARYPIVEAITGCIWVVLALTIERVPVLIAACVGTASQLAAMLLIEQAGDPVLRPRATRAAVVCAVFGVTAVGVAVVA